MNKCIYNVITLCGSTRFKNEFFEVQKRLTLEGNIVLNLGVFSQVDDIALTSEQICMLKEMHRQKIRMSDAIYVINVDGYIGEGTKDEIAYAKSLGKRILYLE